MKAVIIAMFVLGSFTVNAQTMEECRQSVIDSGVDAEYVSDKATPSGDDESSGWMTYYIYANETTKNQDDYIAMCVKNNIVKSCVQQSKNPAATEGICE